MLNKILSILGFGQTTGFIVAPDKQAAYDSLPDSVKTALAAVAPKGTVLHYINPCVDDGMDSTYRNRMGDAQPGAIALVFAFAPDAPAWDSFANVDVMLQGDTRDAVYAIRDKLDLTHRWSCRSKFAPAIAVVTA